MTLFPLMAVITSMDVKNLIAVFNLLKQVNKNLNHILTGKYYT